MIFLQDWVNLSIFALYLIFTSAKVRKKHETCKRYNIFILRFNIYYLLVHFLELDIRLVRIKIIGYE